MDQFRHRAGLLFAAFIIAIGGLVYELIIGAVSSYLLGDSVLQFSLTIGFMLFGMGIGSLLAPRFATAPETSFVTNEVLIALIGGNAPAVLFGLFAANIAFYPAFVFLVTLLGILIGLEIPLMFQILHEKNSELQALSRILALDYIGSLIASLAFPLILLPRLGIVRTAYVIGLGNVLIALLVFVSFRERVKRSVLVVLFIVFGLAVLGWGTWQSEQIAQTIDRSLYRDEVVYGNQSMYQKIVLTRFKEDTRLYLDGNLQFSSIDEYRYHEALVHVPLGFVRSPSQVLVLGGGDGLVARELLKDPRVSRITVVDIDRTMTDLAKTHPLMREVNEGSLNNDRVSVRNEDAWTFLQDSTATYDAIVADLPDPNNEALSKLYSVEFYRLIAKHLAADGVFVTQATSPYFSREAFWIIEASVREAGLFARPYHVQVPSFGEWGFMMGFPRAPKQELPVLSLAQFRFLTPAMLPTLFLFDRDLAKPESQVVNTLIHPSLLKAYLQDARRWDRRP